MSFRRPLLLSLALFVACGGSQGGGSGSESSSSESTGTAGTTESTGLPDPPSDSSSEGSTSTSTSTSTAGSSEDTGPGSPIDPGCPECTVLATDLEGGRGIAVDDAYVYWTEQSGGTVSRVAKRGGQVEVLATDQQSPYQIAVDDAHVYWTNFAESGAVMRLPKAGGRPELVAESLLPRAIEVANGHVYWSTFDGDQGELARRVVTLEQPTEPLVATFGGIADLSVAGEFVYITSHSDYGEGGGFIEPPDPVGSILAIPVTGATDEVNAYAIVDGQSEPWGIAVANDTVFWVNGGGAADWQPNHVRAAGLDGADARSLASGQSGPWGITADASMVYWTDYDQVKASAHAGGPPTVLAEQQHGARSITHDETDLFWITQDRLLQRPKP